MTDQRHRQPKGIRIGGQYAAEQRSPSQVVLDGLGFTDGDQLDADWDTADRADGSTARGPSSNEHGRGVNEPGLRDTQHCGAAQVGVGTETPWGGRRRRSRSRRPGISRVGTAEHGGWLLSPERNAVVPDDLREVSGWYELDCAWAKAAIVFPDEPGVVDINERMRGIDDRADADGITHVERVVRDHYPHEYEGFTGRRVLPVSPPCGIANSPIGRSSSIG